MSISSAPEIYSSSFGATPTALDPYPGFIQNDQGIWEAKDQATYELYLASTTTTAVDAALEESTAAKGKGAEKGFDAKSLKDIVEIDANSGRKAWEAREREVVPKLVAPQGVCFDSLFPFTLLSILAQSYASLMVLLRLIGTAR